ncbi:hypothetical protein MUO65_03970 [bacterium]|nr:hypothetical protein [bacterium]
MRANKLVIGVDLDNVLSLTDPLIRKLIKMMCGVRLEQSDIVEFDYWRCGISKEQNSEVFYRFHRTECCRVKPIKQAVETLQSIKGNYYVYIVTSRPQTIKEQTVQWLKAKEIPYYKLIYCKTKDKSMIDFDIFVEDHRETAYSLAHNGVKSFLIDYPWNQPNPFDPPNLNRVKSWREIRKYLLDILN